MLILDNSHKFEHQIKLQYSDITRNSKFFFFLTKSWAKVGVVIFVIFFEMKLPSKYVGCIQRYAWDKKSRDFCCLKILGYPLGFTFGFFTWSINWNIWFKGQKLHSYKAKQRLNPRILSPERPSIKNPGISTTEITQDQKIPWL